MQSGCEMSFWTSN